jgi:hypothetical protein
MWDVFFEREGADDDAMLQLMAAVEAGGGRRARCSNCRASNSASNSASRSTAC